MRRILPLFALGFLAALACAPAAQQPAPSTTAESKPAYGGVITTFIESDPNDWDLRTQGKTSVNVETHGYVYETLLRFKKGANVDFASQELEPRLAERWAVSPDAKSFTFHLKQGPKFAPWTGSGNVKALENARAVTSDDVKWSLEYWSSKEFRGKKLPASQVEFMYEGLEGIETPDKQTVTVKFKEPYAPFIYYSASQWMPIVAHEVYDKDGDLKSQLVGSGPFIFDQAGTQKGTIWNLKKNPDYWQAGKPYLDGIKKLVLPELATQQAAFQTKQLDVVFFRLTNMAQQVAKANPQAQSYKYQIPIGNALLVSQRRGGALADARVRRAISLAMDREEHSKLLYGGDAQPFLAGSWPGLFTDAEAKEMVKYDPEQAKRLLAEAGYPSPSFEMIVLDTGDKTQEELIQSQLKKAGIDMRFTVLPREQHRPRLYSGDFDFYRNSGGGLLEADADSFLFGEFYGASSLNWSLIKDPDLDRLLVNTRRTLDPKGRTEAMRAAVKRINDQAWDPGIVTPVTYSFWQSYVKDFHPHFANGEDESFVWLEK